MNTVKEILTENRDSVISAIKYNFKVYDANGIKVKMIEFLAFCEKNLTVAHYEATKAKKTFLGDMVRRMCNSQHRAFNIEKFGTATPKLADVMGALHEDEVYNFQTKEYEQI